MSYERVPGCDSIDGCELTWVFGSSFWSRARSPCASPVSGQGPGAANAAAQPAAAAEGVTLLLDRLEALLQKGDRAGFSSLVDTAADPEQVELFGGDLFVTGALRVVVNERDRAAARELAARQRLSRRRRDVHRDVRTGADRHGAPRRPAAERERSGCLAHHRRRRG